MRICLVTSGRLAEEVYGGEEKSTTSLANWLVGRGSSVAIVHRKLFGMNVTEDPSQLAFGSHRTPPAHIIRVPYAVYAFVMTLTALRFALGVLVVNKKKRISLIHAQDTGYSGFAAILSGRFLHIPVVISSHGVRYNTLLHATPPVPRFIMMWEWWLDSFTVRRADAIVGVSSQEETVFSRICPERRIEVIPSGIDLSPYRKDTRQAARNALGIDDQTIAIGFVGRLSPEKNLFNLVRGFEQTRPQIPDACLVLVGGGPLDRELREMCDAEKISDDVRFLGPRPDVPFLLSSFDIFVLPSLTEGSPLALIEAMAAGKPIISSNIRSIRDMLTDGYDALLIDPLQVNQIGQAIVKLSNDSALRERLGTKARERANDFDSNIVFERLYALYGSVLEDSKVFLPAIPGEELIIADDGSKTIPPR